MDPTTTDTRTRIMDAAQALTLERGFGSASVQAVIEAAGVTKGAFFHHFPSKRELGHALLERYARQEEDLVAELLARAERLSGDPLRQLLLFLRLYEEALDQVAGTPGCLFASLIYQAPLLDARTIELARSVFLEWRSAFGTRLQNAMEHHPPRTPVDPEELADMLQAVLEGALILARTLGDPGLVARQTALYRGYLETLFGES